MTQYVLLSTDVTRVVTLFGSPQGDQPNYAALTDSDSRLAAYQENQEALAALRACRRSGLAIVSTSTPALNATYAIDAQTTANLQGLLVGYMLRGVFPGGGATFPYADIAGAPHVVTQPQLQAIAAAIEDYVAALAGVQIALDAGQAASLPAATVTMS